MVETVRFGPGLIDGAALLAMTLAYSGAPAMRSLRMRMTRYSVTVNRKRATS
jgi:hypothetical protein